MAHLPRRARSASRRSAHWTHRRPRRHEVRRLAAIERRVRQTVQRRDMKKNATTQSAAPSRLIDERIEQLGDWRGKTLAKVRKIVLEADPEIVEEWKWAKATSPG